MYSCRRKEPLEDLPGIAEEGIIEEDSCEQNMDMKISVDRYITMSEGGKLY